MVFHFVASILQESKMMGKLVVQVVASEVGKGTGTEKGLVCCTQPSYQVAVENTVARDVTPTHRVGKRVARR